jgi:PAS domain S-box-containing protein
VTEDDALRGIYDEETRIFSGAGLLDAITSRGWTVAQFSATIRCSRTTLHRALSEQPTHPRTVAKIREGLQRRPATRPLISLEGFGDRVAALLVHKDGHILSSTPALRALMGYSHEELSELLVGDLTHPQDMGRANKMLGAIFDGSRPHYYIRKRCVARDGSIHATLATAISLYPEGPPEDAVIILEPVNGAKPQRLAYSTGVAVGTRHE